MEPKPIGELLPTVSENLAPAKPATKPSATTDEQQFAVALRQPRLTDAGEEGLKVVLKRVYAMVGLRAQHLPTGPDKKLLHDFILKHYAQHTAQEIELAFEMALTGQLDLRPEEIRVVDQFTSAHFGRVMAAYRRWAGEVLRLQDSKPPQDPQVQEAEPITDEDMERWLQALKESPVRVEFIPVAMYEWLEKSGRIKPTAAEKWEYLERAVSYRQGQLAKAYAEFYNVQNRDAIKRFNEMKEAGQFTGTEVGILKALSKKMIVYDYILKQ